MDKLKIVVVEDDQDISTLISYNVSKAGYNVVCSINGVEGLETIKKIKPSLVLLDLMLPGMSGLEICKTLKSDHDYAQIPIIMVTAKGTERDIVCGLELGADDYVTKPFSPSVLIARINAVLRRGSDNLPGEDKELSFNGIDIHPGRHEVKVNSEIVKLTSSEFKILHLLARQPGWVFTRDQIVDKIHGVGYAVTDRSIDVQIVGLRKKLGEAGRCIVTIRGVGYKLIEE